MHMRETLLYGAIESELARASADRDRLWIPLDDLERATGWTARPEGLCRGDACVPVPATRRVDWFDDSGRLDFAAFAAHLGHAVVRDEARRLWSFGPPADGAGPESVAAHDLGSGWADIRLPDLDGALHALSDYRGTKVLLYSWASW
jgi:hypothetical protein